MAVINFNKLLGNNFKHGALIVLLTIITFSSFADDKGLTKATPTVVSAIRQINIPKDYVVTPFGYFHPSCVQALSDHANLLADGSVKNADGSIQASSACKFSRYAANGESIQANSQSLTIKSKMTAAASAASVNGWVQESQLRINGSFSGMNASWLVPAAPSYHSGQIIYFFPGLEDYSNVQSILQPVLGWNAFNDSGWTIASWNCCVNGVVNYSSPQRVTTGDQIYGSIQHNCAKGTKICTSWNITTTDQTNSATTTLSKTSNYGQTFDWAFGGVLEVYGVYYCQNYPAGGVIDFTDIALYDVNKTKIGDTALLRWTNTILHQGSCNYGVSSTPTVTTMTY